MATDRREDLATDRRDRKMVIEMAVMKEKTTIIKKVSRVIAAAVIVLEVIETIDRTVRIVQERREDGLDQEISRMNRDSAKAPIEELRGKENTHANKKKNKQDYERKNRKQEQYVNLEKKTGHKKRNAQPQPQAEKKADEVRSIALPEVMTVRELAERIDVPASKVVEKLFMQGILATVNQEIDYEKAEEIALEFNCIAEKEEKVDVIAELLKEEEEDENTLISRPPVVCVRDTLNHGKTFSAGCYPRDTCNGP